MGMLRRIEPRRLMPGATPQTVDGLIASGYFTIAYDPSDMSTLWQDSAGTTPVTAVEQPVGRMLDKSGNGHHAIQATTTKRPVLSARVNLLLGTATLATQNITTRAASHRLTFSGAGSVTLSGTASGVFGAGTHTVACTAGTLTLTVAGAVNDADFRLAIDANPPYQGVNTATDYDVDPNKFPRYLRSDGVDDAMVTVGNVDLSGTDKVTVWAGVTKLSDAPATQFVLTNAQGTDAAGGFQLRAGGGAGSATTAAWYTRGSSTFSLVALGGGAVWSRVITGIGDTAVSSATLRNNSQLVGTDVDIQSPTTFGNSQLTIGGNSYFNGRIYGLIVRGGATGMATVEAVERYLNSKVRAY